MNVNGVRMDDVRHCHCGRRPGIMTGCKGFDHGTGPFVISCMHWRGDIVEQYEKTRRGELNGERYVISRSSYETRAVRNWRALIAATLNRATAERLKCVEPQGGRLSAWKAGAPYVRETSFP